MNNVKIKKFSVTLNCVKKKKVFSHLKLSIMMLLVNLNYQNVIGKQKLLKVVSNLKTNSLLGILLGRHAQSQRLQQPYCFKPEACVKPEVVVTSAEPTNLTLTQSCKNNSKLKTVRV